VEVILREDVDKLGRRGEVVKVAEGYGRNFLLPRGLAMAVTDANKAMIARERKLWEAKAAKEKAEFESLAQRIGGLRFVAPRKVGENDVLYGSVASSSTSARSSSTRPSRSWASTRSRSASTPRCRRPSSCSSPRKAEEAAAATEARSTRRNE
jgi:ribosomal protein L9